MSNSRSNMNFWKIQIIDPLHLFSICSSRQVPTKIVSAISKSNLSKKENRLLMPIFLVGAAFLQPASIIRCDMSKHQYIQLIIYQIPKTTMFTNWCCCLFNFRNRVNISIHSSWLNSIALAIVRIIGLVLMSIRYFAFLGDSSGMAAYDFIYLTFYGFVICWIYFIIVVVHLPVEKLLLKKHAFARTFVGLCVNVIFEAAFALQFVLTLLFWALLASGGTNLGSFDNLGVHLIPFLLLLADFILNSYQFPFRHLSVTFILGAIYIIINQVHACNEKPVYDVYQCGNYWLPIVAFLLLALGHLIGHCVWRFLKVKKVQTLLIVDDDDGSLLQGQSLEE